jgi:hypothetical protein
VESKGPVDAEIDKECRVGMELNNKVMLHNCSHTRCIKVLSSMVRTRTESL